MIIVLADDFSGAAEIGGIGHRFGLTAKVQFDTRVRDKAELVVIDTNTRSLKEEDAILKIRQVVDDLKKLNEPLQLFKKVDSVMRGHIAAEINILQYELRYNRVLLLPANPSRGRKIISGHYYVNDTSLDKTVFSNDPDFPVNSSSVETLLSPDDLHLHYVHIPQNKDLPPSSFITGDVETKKDIKNYIHKTNENDLCCGAAECFEAWLENLGYADKYKTPPVEQSPNRLPFTLILNGSTVKNPEERNLFKKLNVPQLSLPGDWHGDQFRLNEEKKIFFQQQVLDVLQLQHIAAVSIDHPVKQLKGNVEVFSVYFVKLMRYISDAIGMNNIHFCLTGGATSFALIDSTGIRDFYVKEEAAPGIVTLKSSDETKGLFTVKPGSYPWPQSFFENLSKQ